MNAKRFFCISAGTLLLVVTFGVGAHRAAAQSEARVALVAGDHVMDPSKRIIDVWTGRVLTTCPGPGTPIGFLAGGNDGWVIMENGDVWTFTREASCAPTCPHVWSFSHNVFGTAADAAPPVRSRTWGGAKDTYRK